MANGIEIVCILTLLVQLVLMVYHVCVCDEW